VKRGALKAACVFNVKDGSPNTDAARKGYLHAYALHDTGPHSSPAENSLSRHPSRTREKGVNKRP
jgi:hypothetical protein